MDLLAVIEAVNSKDSLAMFVDQLRHDLGSNPDGWENTDIAAYLEAISAWLQDMDGFYQNLGQPIPSSPSWRTFGEILLAARGYE